MSCKCIEKIEKKLQDKGHKEAVIDKTYLVQMVPLIEYSYKNGKKTKRGVIIPQYCPFCGKRYGRKMT